MLPDDDVTKFELIRRQLYTPVIGDVLDTMGRHHQFLPPGIAPLTPDMVVVGRAMPVLVTDVFGAQRRPFGRLTEALDQLQPGEVYLARGGLAEASAWGEILTATARVRGAAGAVVDAYHRDTPRILEQNWPVFSRGSFAQDAGVRTSVLDYRVPIEFGRTAVSPGDLVFGDQEGVLIVPSDVEDEVLEAALVKAMGEKTVRRAIEGGMPSTEAFATFGIL